MEKSFLIRGTPNLLRFPREVEKEGGPVRATLDGGWMKAHSIKNETPVDKKLHNLGLAQAGKSVNAKTCRGWGQILSGDTPLRNRSGIGNKKVAQGDHSISLR